MHRGDGNYTICRKIRGKENTAEVLIAAKDCQDGAFIEQHAGGIGKNIVAAESRQRLADRMKKVDAPNRLPKHQAAVQKQYHSGNDVLFVEELSKTFRKRTVQEYQLRCETK